MIKRLSPGLFLLFFFYQEIYSQPPIQKFWALNQCTLLTSKISVKPSAAYSLRKLSCTYNGYIIRVRRSAPGTNNNAIGDVSFDANGVLSNNSEVLITTAGTGGGGGRWTVGTRISFATFYAGASVFVVTWYDQSGNAYNVTQATNSQQPRIVNAGAVETINGKPTVRFINANSTVLNYTVNIATIFGTQPNGTASLVLEAVNGTTSAFGYSNGGGNRWQAHIDESNLLHFDVGNAYNRLDFTNTANEGLLRTYALVAGAANPSMQIWVSGAQVANSNPTITASTGLTNFHLGGIPEFPGTYYHNGRISEALFFPKQLGSQDLTRLNLYQKMFYATP